MEKIQYILELLKVWVRPFGWQRVSSTDHKIAALKSGQTALQKRQNLEYNQCFLYTWLSWCTE